MKHGAVIYKQWLTVVSRHPWDTAETVDSVDVTMNGQLHLVDVTEGVKGLGGGSFVMDG